MSDQDDREVWDQSEEDDGPRNPFDNPYFLPVALFAFALWFGYDGWFNPHTESVMFNRVMFPIVLAAAGVFFVRARREVQEAGSEREGD